MVGLVRHFFLSFFAVQNEYSLSQISEFLVEIIHELLVEFVKKNVRRSQREMICHKCVKQEQFFTNEKHIFIDCCKFLSEFRCCKINVNYHTWRGFGENHNILEERKYSGQWHGLLKANNKARMTTVQYTSS